MEISNEVFQWKGAKNANQFMVFCHLAIMAEDYKVSFSLRNLAEQIGVCHMTVRRVLSKLEEEGIITQSVTQGVTDVTIYRYVTCSAKKKKGVTKSVTAEKDLTSFVAPEHLAKWNEWLQYRSSIRKQFANTDIAKKNYEKLIKISTVTVIDYKGISTKIIDINKLNRVIDYSIENQYQGLFEPKNDGNSINNPKRTSQQNAERIAAQHSIDAAQSSFDSERRKAEIQASLGLFG